MTPTIAIKMPFLSAITGTSEGGQAAPRTTIRYAARRPPATPADNRVRRRAKASMMCGSFSPLDSGDEVVIRSVSSVYRLSQNAQPDRRRARH
jgi:hypothetical protein